LAPIGGTKGAALALMIEILCGALAGGRYGWEASSFLDDRGGPPGVGQVLVAFDPEALGGSGFATRMEGLLAAFQSDVGVRLPGDRRLASREKTRVGGIAIAPELHAQIDQLAGGGAGA